MKRNLEITFMDGTKTLHMAETWNNFIFRDDGILRIEYNGKAFAWYPIRNIKSIMAMEEEDAE
jgi:hypothetical protein